MSLLLSSLALALLVTFPVYAAAQTLTFGDAPLGALPVSFEMALTGQGGAVDWKIVADPTAENGRALAQTSADRTDYRFPLAIYRPMSAKDLEVTIRFKAVSGAVDRAGGIALRLQSPDDYYVVRANALEDNVRLYQVIKGRREMIAGKNVKVTADQWHTLMLRAEGDQLTVAFDGQSLFTIGNTMFPAAGKVALWTKADSVTYFDRLDIRNLSVR